MIEFLRRAVRTTEEEKQEIKGWEIRGNRTDNVLAQQGKTQGDLWETRGGKEQVFVWKDTIK